MSESKPTPAQAWREMVEKATPGPWHDHAYGHANVASAAAVVVEALSKGETSDLYYVHDDLCPDGSTICLTGNGPSSQQNARLIVAQRRVAEALVEWINAEEHWRERPNPINRERCVATSGALFAACVEAVGAKG